MQSSILLIASAAALAAATAPTTNIHARSLAFFRRQDSTPSAECLSAAIDIVSSIPPPAADVLAYLATAPDSVTSDPCRITFPASLSSDVEDWVTSLSAFSSESASALSSIISECGGADATDLAAGSTDAAATTAGGDSGAADRLPFGAAVVAVAGVVGIVAAL
ncbi:Mitogen-activated protein kinase HOG1 [Verticillium dahliae VDG2]|nr:Mitogen-activated protein kinase HOG1 [Verticillium dahliae VDG2]